MRLYVSGVAISPGQMQLTRILSLANSIEADRVRLITPALAAQYACKPGAARSPAIDAVEMMEPPPVLRISGTACLMPRNTARSRIEKLRSQFSALVLSSDPTAPPRPAWLYMTSRRPNSLSARSTALLIFSSLETSVSWKTALPPFSLQSRTAASPPSRLRSAITTAAPSPANRIAVARPIPLAAPVMTATFFSSLPMNSLRIVLKYRLLEAGRHLSIVRRGPGCQPPSDNRWNLTRARD